MKNSASLIFLIYLSNLFVTMVFTVVAIALSYGLLFLLNQILITFPEIGSILGMSGFNIEFYHLLLISILISISFAITLILDDNSDYTNEYMFKNIFTLLENIKDRVDNIESNTNKPKNNDF